MKPSTARAAAPAFEFRAEEWLKHMFDDVGRYPGSVSVTATSTY